MRRSMFLCAAALALGAFTFSQETPAARQQSPAPADDALIAKARGIHDRVIALDTHVDISPTNFTPERNYTQELTNKVNLPKMFKGGLDAVFLIVYVGQNQSPEAFTTARYDEAYKAAIEKFDAIHRLTKEIAPDKIGLALTSADARRLNKEGKKIAFIGVENGYPLGDESTAIKRVQEFQQRGARYLSLAHNGHSQLADSNTGERDNVWLHNGLSPLGKQVIAELNRVGIMVDISHPSKESNLQAMALSKAPVIASHSGARAVQNHSRNMDDELLLALKKNGGVVQAVALGTYVKETPASPERSAAITKLNEQFGLPAQGGGRGGRGGGGRGALAQLPEDKRAEYQRLMTELNAKFPPPPSANVKDFVDHIDYIKNKIGIDHVGISSDFDGGGGIEGWNDASETFNVTLELVRRGYSEAQIAKIWSGNLLRVLDDVQKRAQKK